MIGLFTTGQPENVSAENVITRLFIPERVATEVAHEFYSR
jgi:hypothetical protein